MNPPPPYGGPPPSMGFPGPPLGYAMPGVLPGAHPGFPGPPLMPRPAFPMQRPLPGPTAASLAAAGAAQRPPAAAAATPNSGPTPAATPATATPVSLTGAPPTKSTTLYVGKIAPSVEEELLRKLLEACGPVKSWKRVSDPETGKPKGFGFLEYEDAEGVLRAQRLLGNLALDGQELLLKPNSATAKYLAHYQARASLTAAAARAAAAAASAEGGDVAAKAAAAEPTPAQAEEAEDNRVLGEIMALISDRATSASAARSRSAADSFLASLPDGGSERRRGSSAGGAADRSEAEAERNLQRKFEAARAAARREEEAAARELERAYRDKLYQWERWERDHLKELDKERERQKDAERERARQIRADLEAGASDDDEPPWRRKPIRASRRAEERRRRREREEAEDAADREKEATEPPAKRRKESASPVGESAAENGRSEAGPGGAGFGGEPPSEGSAGAAVDPNDPIYQAMMAAAKAPHQPAARAAAAAAPSASPASLSTAPASGAPAASLSAGGTTRVRNKALSAVFGGGDEDEQPKRKLIPLQYTEEELRAQQAAQATSDSRWGPAGGSSAQAPEQAAKEDPAQIKKRIMDSVPTTKEGVFAHAVSWQHYDAAQPDMGRRLAGWASKKVGELLGAPDADLVEFIMDKLAAHEAAPALLAELGPLLGDKEAEAFVLKLYRMVVYETEKHAAGV